MARRASIVVALGGAAVGAAAMWLVMRPPRGDEPVDRSAASAPPVEADAAPAPPPDAPFDVVDAGLPRRGQWRHGLALVDLDGDGRRDLVHGPARKGARIPIVFRQADGPRFSPWDAARFPPGPYDYGDVAAADLDHDGQVDLVLAAHQQGLRALVGDGRGAFADRPLPAAAATFSSRAVVVADLDRDATPEIYALSDGPVRGGKGAGARRGLLRVEGDEATIVPGSERLFGDGLALGDGFVVVASAVLGATELRCADRCATLEGLAPGALVRAADVLPDGRVVAALAIVVDGAWATAIDLIDDGHATRRFVEPGRNAVTALTHGDLDHDGLVDLVAARDDGELVVLTGADRVVRWTAPPWRSGCAGFDLAVADVDGDARRELIATFAGEGGSEPAPRCPDGGGFEVLRLR